MNMLGTQVAFCTGFFRLEVREQALGGIPLDLGLVMKRKVLNLYVHLLGLYICCSPYHALDG